MNITVLLRWVWGTLDGEEEAPYICQFPQKNIGYLTEGDNGVDYNGTASKTASGQDCVNWNTPGIEQIGQLSSWSHNYCRNPGGEDDVPGCFTDLESYDYCDIPKSQSRHVS